MHKCRVKNINKYGVIKCSPRTGRGKKGKNTSDRENRKNNGVDFKSTNIKNCSVWKIKAKHAFKRDGWIG